MKLHWAYIAFVNLLAIVAGYSAPKAMWPREQYLVTVRDGEHSEQWFAVAYSADGAIRQVPVEGQKSAVRLANPTPVGAFIPGR